MKISDFLSKEAVCTDLKSETKVDVIGEMVTMLVEAGIIEKKHKNKIIIFIEILLVRVMDQMASVWSWEIVILILFPF